MASLPGYSASSRPQSSDNNTTSTTQQNSVSTNITSSASSTESFETSDTVLLNGTSDTATAGGSPTSPTLADASGEEPRRCWICYTDETEDSPLNSQWRSPCPCALTAHEACLLDWLADLENPRSRRRNGHDAKMLCPQCKTEIIVSRPRSYIVDVVRLVERLAGRMVLPGMVFTLGATVWAGCCAHGVYSMYFVFGTDEARQILEETADGAWNSGLNLGLPLIPLVLIFSRTRYADGLLPAIPVMFFATHQPGQELELDLWPPSAAVTFAALPYLKSFYGSIYERMFGKLERRWIAEVQPRQSDVNEFDDNAPPEHPEPDPPNDDNGVLMEIDLELRMGNEDGPQGLFGFNGGNAQGGQGQNQGGNGQPLGLGRRDELVADTSSLADIILGALAFPAISASMGGLLKYLLPTSWTTPSTLGKVRPGLLQTRWGRSVVGGCAFVLLKDALVLYCRWKLAQTHRRRKVLNYDRSKKRVGKAGS
ncbi:hypothetical protein CBS115989_1287 [Aspergillus niger]|uniref:Contig An16c0160, genomic contig n=3 Tax=Aspergillus niger TaxID=5061 RepID=A2R7N7_ASPNC|nr:uncharacterized protein An16g04180 [Aspergillus niger]RDH21692.1 hypothetical protein M747DRAFT_369530 [Aspergillus niger ATCC 13496]KAI2823698.1 hypothetical protein CBS115989_1287 [Aspergillus niger]KAI2829683.1 hypothetical protein CBS133816_4112 [Aspergillus niger]KAI2838153.1 hypothetical protein CBS11350_8367 [Aspergillus niger]KAI2858719.1 hypothetical protein CBS11232_2485 [Aspergillus niger]|eukprot:XP_001397729.1 RING finger domain protein [Aspergillus niger CBS 513.88]